MKNIIIYLITIILFSFTSHAFTYSEEFIQNENYTFDHFYDVNYNGEYIDTYWKFEDIDYNTALYVNLSTYIASGYDKSFDYRSYPALDKNDPFANAGNYSGLKIGYVDGICPYIEYTSSRLSNVFGITTIIWYNYSSIQYNLSDCMDYIGIGETFTDQQDITNSTQTTYLYTYQIKFNSSTGDSDESVNLCNKTIVTEAYDVNSTTNATNIYRLFQGYYFNCTGGGGNGTTTTTTTTSSSSTTSPSTTTTTISNITSNEGYCQPFGCGQTCRDGCLAQYNTDKCNQNSYQTCITYCTQYLNTCNQTLTNQTGIYTIITGGSNTSSVNFGTIPFNFTGNITQTNKTLGLSNQLIFKIAALLILTIIAWKIEPIQIKLIGLFFALNFFTQITSILTLTPTLLVLIAFLILLELGKRKVEG